MLKHKSKKCVATTFSSFTKLHPELTNWSTERGGAIRSKPEVFKLLIRNYTQSNAQIKSTKCTEHSWWNDWMKISLNAVEIGYSTHRMIDKYHWSVLNLTPYVYWRNMWIVQDAQDHCAKYCYGCLIERKALRVSKRNSCGIRRKTERAPRTMI